MGTRMRPMGEHSHAPDGRALARAARWASARWASEPRASSRGSRPHGATGQPSACAQHVCRRR
eukprot:387689-Prymnesium_polylepis.1